MNVLGYIEGKLHKGKLKICLYNYIKDFPAKYGRKYDAVVRIGGSIFMDRNKDEELPFTIDRKITRHYEFCSIVQNQNGLFLIGVNMSPVYHSGYWEERENQIKKCNHVCIRDYSSYYPFRHLKNVQYAPDVGFCTEVLGVQKSEKNMIVISLIEIERKTKDREETESYYELMAQTVKYYSGKGKKVVLLSLCSKEGDMSAIKRLEGKISGAAYTIFNYCGNLKETIALFANAEYIICSRFHAMIMGLLFDKPICPICYNCKMKNYLYDLPFNGKYIELGKIKYATLDDVDYNYNQCIVTDTEQHKKYAGNQFMGLERYLRKSISREHNSRDRKIL